VVFFTDNFLSWWGYDTQVPFSPHLWTLSYEFQIYLVIPLAFLLYQALGTKRFLLLLGALWFVALGARLAFVLLNVKHPAIWVTPFLRPESTLLGMVIALGVLNRIPGILIAGLAAAGVVVLMLIPNVDAIGPSTLIIYPIAAVICGSALWAAINAKRLAGLVLSRPWLVFLGKISFGLYVFHFYAMWLTALMLKHIPSLYPFNYLSNIAVSLVFSFCLSTASYFLFERFFLRLKMRFSAIENRPI
jgi:peptidoglycan/LPS O-acetylase OafA/YrhL